MSLKSLSRILKWATILMVVAYLLGPVVAAALRYSDRRGPEIYHETVFIIAHESFHDGEKPRLPLGVGKRQWFY